MTDAGKITAIIDGDISGITSALNQAKGQATAAASGIEGSFRSGMGGLKSGLGSELSASFSGMAASMGPVGGALSALGPAGIAAGAGIAVVGSAISSSITTAAGFQQQMAGVAAIMGSTGPELQAMSDAAREAGATTQFSASQAAEAISYMAGAGWDSQQATAGLKDTLTLAAAGGMDLAAAGDLMTNSVAQFNLTAEDSGRVANVLAAGAAATNTGVAQLGAGMGVVGATAAAFGMSIESTTAALGSLSNAGIKGAEGGTALRGILASLATQSGPAAAALEELGVSAADVNPETVSLGDAMTLLNEKGMTATQAIAIFGRENVSAATYLASHASALDGLETSITGTTKAEEMAAIQTDTYEGAMGELSSAVEEAQIALGTVLLPVVTDVAQAFTFGVTAATDLGKGIGTAVDAISSGDFSLVGMGIMKSDDEYRAMGAQAGDAIGEGVSTSEDLAAAPGEALGSPEAKKAAADAGKELAEEVFDENAWALAAQDVMIKAAQASAGRNKAEWKNDIGETLGFTTVGDVGVTYTLDASKNQSWVVLKTENGEIARKQFRGESDREQAIKDLVDENAEALGLDAIGEMELQGKYLDADRLTLEAEAGLDVVLDAYIDVSQGTKTEVEAAGQMVTDAYLAGMRPEKEQVDAALESIKNLQFEDPEEAKAQGSENAIAYLTGLSQAIESYDAAKAKYLVEPDNELALADLIQTRSNLDGYLKNNPLTVEVKAGWGQFDTKSFAELIMDPEAVKNAAVDIDKFFDGTIVPGIKGGMEAARAAFDSGQITQDQVYENLIKPLEQYGEYLPGWLEEMNTVFHSKQIDIEDYLWLLDQMTGKASDALDKTSEKVKDQTVGWDALKNSMEDCADCAISDFAVWQEAQDGLFQDSYIGQGGQQYLDWKTQQISAIAETQAAMDAVGGAVLGQRYEMPTTTMTIDADPSPAEAARARLEEEITNTRLVPKLELDTSIADARFQNFCNLVQNARPVMYFDAVPLVDIGALTSAIADALRAAGV